MEIERLFELGRRRRMDHQAFFLDLLKANYGRWRGIARVCRSGRGDLFQEILFLQVWRAIATFEKNRP